MNEYKQRYPHLKILLGGYLATYDYSYLKDLSVVDAIIGGEADESIVCCCKDILGGELTNKLKYLKFSIPDLANYDYKNNIINYKNCLIVETSRSCPRATTQRCGYCCQFPLPFRTLKIEETIKTIEENISDDIIAIIINSPICIPKHLNLIYETFGIPISAYIDPFMAKYISTEKCVYLCGFDYPLQKNAFNPHKNIDNTIIKDLERLLYRNNMLSLNSVYVQGDEQRWDVYEKLVEKHTNLQIAVNTFIEMPGVNDNPQPENIYLNYNPSLHLGLNKPRFFGQTHLHIHNSSECEDEFYNSWYI